MDYFLIRLKLKIYKIISQIFNKPILICTKKKLKEK